MTLEVLFKKDIFGQFGEEESEEDDADEEGDLLQRADESGLADPEIEGADRDENEREEQTRDDGERIPESAALRNRLLHRLHHREMARGDLLSP